MVRVAIVVVTHQSAHVIGPCLDSLAALQNVEIIVVDNASTDSTRSEVTGRDSSQHAIRLIANAENVGFAAAVNQGVEATSAPLILLLNPDACLETGIESLERCFDDPVTGGAGGLLTGTDGRPQTGFMARNLPTPATLILEVLGVNRIWPGNRVNWHYRCSGMDPMVCALVDQPAGAFFMFRRSAWRQMGGFDENFRPVWFEDVDFCLRLRAAGFLVRYQPLARAVHRGGHSVGAVPLEIREKYWYGSLLKYAGKHFRPAASCMVCLAVVAGAAGRAVFAFPQGGLRVVRGYSSVIRLAFASLTGGGVPSDGTPGSAVPGPGRDR